MNTHTRKSKLSLNEHGRERSSKKSKQRKPKGMENRPNDMHSKLLQGYIDSDQLVDLYISGIQNPMECKVMDFDRYFVLVKSRMSVDGTEDGAVHEVSIPVNKSAIQFIIPAPSFEGIPDYAAANDERAHMHHDETETDDVSTA